MIYYIYSIVVLLLRESENRLPETPYLCVTDFKKFSKFSKIIFEQIINNKIS